MGLLIPLLIAVIGIPASSFIEGMYSARSLEYNGEERTYLMYGERSSSRQEGQPLIIALHDNGSSARNLVRISQGRLNKRAEDHGFVLVYPEGLRKRWILNGSAAANRKGRNSDVGFIKMLIESVKEDAAIDESRIFITGMGSGGALAYQLACAYPGMFRAIGVVAASMPVHNLDACETTSNTSMLMINGTENPVVPYEGGHAEMIKGGLINVVSTEATIALWLKNNGCLYHAEEHLLPNVDRRDGTSVSRYDYAGCDSDVKVVLYCVRGGGHTWPGGRQYAKEERVGRTSRDIDAGKELWAFFSSF